MGMGGVGKTTLAVVIANRLQDMFPDGRLMLNLRGTSEAPLSTTQALQQVIHNFTPDTQLPDDLEKLQRHYRSVLHSKRVLILADDVANATQVRPLIPPAGSALLFTSRMRFALPGMVTIDLTPLGDTDAITFLQHLCPSLTHAEAQALAQACGYLPLALRVSGSLLSSDSALEVADYLERLRDECRRLALLRDPEDPALDVAATLALSYARLDAAAQVVFRQLGVFAADFTTELACAVVAAPATTDVEEVLHALLRRNLVMYDRERVRWCLHDLVRDLARHHLERSRETESLRWRYARAVLPLAQKLHEQYLGGVAKASAALARFDTERPHLEAAWTWGGVHSGAADGAHISLTLALATTHLGEIRLDPQRERIPLLKGALSAARLLGRLHDEGMVLLFLGRAVFSAGAIREAIGLWEQARTIFQRLEDRHNEGRTLGNLGTAFARLGRPQEAVPVYMQALEIFRALGDQRREGHALGNLGAAYAEDGAAQSATPYLKKALAHARTVGDRRFEGMLLRALSEVARASGKRLRAGVLCARALAIARELGDRQQEAYALMSQGCLFVVLNRGAGAVAAFEQALVVLQALGDHWGVAECGWHYGLALVAQKDMGRALALLRASVAYQTTIGHAKASAHAALLARLSDEADHDVVSPPPDR